MIGDVFEIYNNFLITIDGFTENKIVDEADFVPSSISDKNWFLEFDDKNPEAYLSGNMENAKIPFTIKILFRVKRKYTRAENQKSIWNNVGFFERKLITFADTRGEYCRVEEMPLEDFDTDHKLCTIKGTLIYLRSLTI